MRAHEIDAHKEQKDNHKQHVVERGVSTSLYSSYFKRLCEENDVLMSPHTINQDDQSGLIPHATRLLIHNELLKQFSLNDLLLKKNKIFYGLVPLQNITARIKSRAAVLLNLALLTPSPWDTIVKGTLMEFWSYILTNVCNEDTAVTINMNELGPESGIALQITYSIGVGSSDTEFALQECIYLNLFNLLQSAMSGMIFDGDIHGNTQAFSMRRLNPRTGQWRTYLGFTRGDTR
jgi:hypothetical protein